MNKQELLSTYTAEQLADMLIKTNNLIDMLKYSDSFLKTGLFDNPAAAALEARLNIAQNRIKNLEEGNGRLQAKVDTYNEYLLPRCTKKARRMIDENRFSEVRIATWDEWNNQMKDAMNLSKIQKCREEYEKLMKESPLQRTIDGIARDILEQKNNAMAMEFTKAICGLLEKYGVRINCTEMKHQNITHNLIEEVYGIIFDSVDFSKHDKEFTDKIEELKKENDELKTENAELHCEMQAMSMFPDEFPTEPIKVADMLISATYTRKKSNMEMAMCKAFGNNADTVTENVYSKSELRQIAEHLLVYCNHNEEAEG